MMHVVDRFKTDKIFTNFYLYNDDDDDDNNKAGAELKHQKEGSKQFKPQVSACAQHTFEIFVVFLINSSLQFFLSHKFSLFFLAVTCSRPHSSSVEGRRRARNCQCSIIFHFTVAATANVTAATAVEDYNLIETCRMQNDYAKIK